GEGCWSVGLARPGGVDGQVPRRRVVEAGGADLRRYAVMVQLADAGHEIAVLLERLRQRDGIGDVLAEVGLVLVDLRGVGAQAGQERRPAWVAKRELAVGPIEAHALLGEPIDIRRPD